MTKTTATLANGVTVSVDNIVNVFRAASHDDHVNGMRWYEDAHNLASAMAFGDVTMGAAVIAALSPRTR